MDEKWEESWDEGTVQEGKSVGDWYGLYRGGVVSRGPKGEKRADSQISGKTDNFSQGEPRLENPNPSNNILIQQQALLTAADYHWARTENKIPWIQNFPSQTHCPSNNLTNPSTVASVVEHQIKVATVHKRKRGDWEDEPETEGGEWQFVQGTEGSEKCEEGSWGWGWDYGGGECRCDDGAEEGEW